MQALADFLTGVTVFVVILFGFLAIVGSFFVDTDFWKEL